MSMFLGFFSHVQFNEFQVHSSLVWDQRNSSTFLAANDVIDLKRIVKGSMSEDIEKAPETTKRERPEDEQEDSDGKIFMLALGSKSFIRQR